MLLVNLRIFGKKNPAAYCGKTPKGCINIKLVAGNANDYSGRQ